MTVFDKCPQGKAYYCQARLSNNSLVNKNHLGKTMTVLWEWVFGGGPNPSCTFKCCQAAAFHHDYELLISKVHIYNLLTTFLLWENSASVGQKEHWVMTYLVIRTMCRTTVYNASIHEYLKVGREKGKYNLSLECC